MGKLREALSELATCGLPSALEVMGERWSFLILRAACCDVDDGFTARPSHSFKTNRYKRSLNYTQYYRTISCVLGYFSST